VQSKTTLRKHVPFEQLLPAPQLLPAQQICPEPPQLAQLWLWQIWLVVHVLQAPPPLPQAESAVPAWHLFAEQQPDAHALPDVQHA
jgi:hypothetical protein